MHKPAAQPRFAWRYIFAGMALSILPVLLILHQSYKIGHGTTLRLPVQISRVQDQGFFPKLALTTPLNQISTKSVAGENHFIIGKKIFVFLSPGPNDIWYPYAVSRRQPKANCQQPDCLSLSGMVTDIFEDKLSIRYQYEDFTPSPAILAKMPEANAYNAEVSLSVGKDGRSTVRALHIAGQTLNQRKIVMPVEFGFTHNGDSAAPAK